MDETITFTTSEILPHLKSINVRAIIIECRHRSPVYIAIVPRPCLQAIDFALHTRKHYLVRSSWTEDLDRLCEGSQHTLGAYHRPWK